MSQLPRSAAAAVAAAALLTSGCFSYVPVETAAVSPGEEVRVYLTRQGLASVEQLNLEEGPIVRGSVVEQDASQLLLRVPVTSVREGFHSVPIGQDVRIPSDAILQMERRVLDRSGTGLLVAGTAAMAAGVVWLIVDSGGGREEDDPPSPPEIRIPLFSVSVP